MKKGLIFFAAAAWSAAAWFSAALGQSEHFVWSGGSHTPPFTNWATAAHDIQSAINTSAPGAVIWVTNGVYNTGGVSNYPTRYGLTNRVAIHKPLIVRSVNGPAGTFIVGRWHVPGDTGNRHGSNAVRCVWMTNGAALIGFSISNGATTALGDNANLRAGGGLLGQSTNLTVSNCVFVNCTAAYAGGGGAQGSFYDCLFSNCYAGGGGGGASYGRYYNCRFAGCYAGGQGGGASDGYVASLFQDCVFSNNYSASQYGGTFAGSAATVFSNCLYVGNSANLDAGGAGGGAYGGGNYYGCVFRNNTAVTRDAGGASGGMFYNCEFYNNTAFRASGAFDYNGYYGTLYNCLIYSNRSASGSGGVTRGALYDCAIYNNTGNRGGGATGCALYRCRIFGNTSSLEGGGAYYNTNYSCVISRNVSLNNNGGGMYAGVAYNCLLLGNQGYGMRDAWLYNCTVAGNHLQGSVNGTLFNSILYYNQNNYSGSTFNNSCTFPAVGGWAEGNITNAPMFADPGSAAGGYGTNYVIGDYHLRKESHCVNKGAYYDWMAPGDAHGRDRDLDGGPRIRHNAVDMGPYETRLSRGMIFNAE